MARGRMEQAIEKLLLAVDRPGDFCAHGRLLAPMPRLDVKGAGALSFPVPEAQVQALIAVAERAPYGKGAGNGGRPGSTRLLADRRRTDSFGGRGVG